jgi:hypothetical protein
MGMGNLIKYIRYEISHVAPDLSEADAKVRGLCISVGHLLPLRLLVAHHSTDLHIPLYLPLYLHLMTGASSRKAHLFS